MTTIIPMLWKANIHKYMNNGIVMETATQHNLYEWRELHPEKKSKALKVCIH